MKKENIFKRIVSTVLATAMVVGSVALAPEFAQTAHATNIVQGNMPVVSNAEDGKNVPSVFTQSVRLGEKSSNLPHDTKGYFKFVLGEDSWVHFTGSYSLCNNDGAGTIVKIFGDEAFSNEVLDYGWGYWQTEEEDSAFLKKGVYYGYVYTSHENYKTFEGNVNVTAFAIPLSKVFKLNKKMKKGKTVVTINDTLGEYAKSVQYINRSVGKSFLNKTNIWKSVKSYGIYDGDKKTKILTVNGNDQYTFKAKKTGKYTIMVEDNQGNRYQKVFKIKVKK